MLVKPNSIFVLYADDFAYSKNWMVKLTLGCLIYLGPRDKGGHATIDLVYLG
jgi:hypothetical protein